MDNSLVLPNPDLVYDAYTGIYKTQLVRLALQLDLFTPLAKGPADAASVARACDCDATGARALLDYLHSLKLLDKQGEAYALTPTAATFLVPAQKSFAGNQVLQETDPQVWERIANAFRTGKPSRHLEDVGNQRRRGSLVRRISRVVGASKVSTRYPTERQVVSGDQIDGASQGLYFPNTARDTLHPNR